MKNESYLTLGPILFHWPAEKKRDFYFKIADESPINTVYLGEVICSKRSPFFEDHYADVSERLLRAGKKVVFSSLSEVMIARERKMTAGLCEMNDFEIEANDASALYHLRGKSHRIGQYFNTYNEETLSYLAQHGATHITIPAELPASAIAILCKAAYAHNVCLEAQVYGRVGLALSARCYHARSHGRVKDNCQFVCEQDQNGLSLKTVDGKNFLCINGVQTLSHTCLNLVHEIGDMKNMGIKAFRISPHDCDMLTVIECFSAVLNNKISAEDADKKISESGLNAPSANGFYHGHEGYRWKNSSHQ